MFAFNYEKTSFLHEEPRPKHLCSDSNTNVGHTKQQNSTVYQLQGRKTSSILDRIRYNIPGARKAIVEAEQRERHNEMDVH